MKVILASSSAYRKKQLATILKSFETKSPNIDESTRLNEKPEELAIRLATEKARVIANKHENALVIGSDQVAWLEGKQLHKPGNTTNNTSQLRFCSGKTVSFYTGLCLINTSTGKIQSDTDRFRTTFNDLSDEEIKAYVNKEQAFDCAGGFKVEGLGISLFSRLEGDDPNALIGLPLIKLVRMLKNEGLNVITA